MKKIILLFAIVLYFVSTNMVFAQSQNEQETYLSNLENKIKANWNNPIIPQSQSFCSFCSTNKDAPFSSIALQRIMPDGDYDINTLVSFTINNDGSFSNIEIQRSSNDQNFDKSAINAISKTASFEPLAGNETSLNVLYFFSPGLTSLSITDKAFKPKNNTIVNVANVPPPLTNYAQDLQDKIVSNWNPRSLKKKRNAIILLSLYKSGKIKDLKIQKSSNKKKFDLEILDAIMKSVPFKPLPSNVKDECRNIQINFSYEKTSDKNNPKKYVVADISSNDGYDEYIEQVEKIVSHRLKDRTYFCKKDIILEMNINKNGELTYVKLKNASPKDRFIRKEFNRKTLVAIQKIYFPPIPDEVSMSNIMINYRVLTQRRRLFRYLITDYVLNFFKTGLESFCVQAPANI